MKEFINRKVNSNQHLTFVRFLRIFVEPEALKNGFIDNSEFAKYKKEIRLNKIRKINSDFA